jgi:four helix bundle protein
MQNGNCKMQNEEDVIAQRRGNDLSQRLLVFGSRCLKLCSTLSRSVVGRWVANQLVRCSTSAGANYEEACGAESRADFVHKMQVVLKELRESCYSLALTEKSELVPAHRLNQLAVESKELVRIFSKSVITAKQNQTSQT